MSILVSGVTGWMGQSLCRIVKDGSLPFHTGDLIGLTSRLSQQTLTNSITLEDFSKDPFEHKVEGFVHLAFLTRDKVSKMPLDEYVRINREIIARAIQIIHYSKPKWVALVSSGAVFSRESDFTEFESSILDNPYGFLKIEEEKEITDAAREVGSNLAIGRLWGATGRDLPIDAKYAISDFIQSAMQKRRIELKSEHQVFRRYCDASEFMNVLINSAIRARSQVFNSGGPLVELEELAIEIASQVGECEINRNLRPGANPDNYFPKDDSYETLAESLGVATSGLSAQVSRTISGHT
jgi:nucleoside-diphosphate-sugar epimerase